jgi:16S rRNA (guanine527-N7)-methyltransferase
MYLFTFKQIDQFSKLQELYVHWNEQINIISRKDTDNFYERHVLHSLGIAKVIQFNKDTKIMDVGTGGGFPGIPLAILFPDCDFLLVDSIGKKIKVVNEVAHELGLKNVRGLHERVEKVDGTFDFVVSRAVTQMPEFITWVKSKVSKTSKNSIPNGILYLKGGDLSEEMKTVKQWSKEYKLKDFFEGEFFETKKVVFVKF